MSYVENPNNAKCLPHETIKVIHLSVWLFEVFLIALTISGCRNQLHLSSSGD